MRDSTVGHEISWLVVPVISFAVASLQPSEISVRGLPQTLIRFNRLKDGMCNLKTFEQDGCHVQVDVQSLTKHAGQPVDVVDSVDSDSRL